MFRTLLNDLFSEFLDLSNMYLDFSQRAKVKTSENGGVLINYELKNIADPELEISKKLADWKKALDFYGDTVTQSVEITFAINDDSPVTFVWDTAKGDFTIKDSKPSSETVSDSTDPIEAEVASEDEFPIDPESVDFDDPECERDADDELLSTEREDAPLSSLSGGDFASKLKRQIIYHNSAERYDDLKPTALAIKARILAGEFTPIFDHEGNPSGIEMPDVFCPLTVPRSVLLKELEKETGMIPEFAVHKLVLKFKPKIPIFS